MPHSDKGPIVWRRFGSLARPGAVPITGRNDLRTDQRLMTARDLDINVGLLGGPPIDRLRVEVVERKGLGHPDSICDALAEAFSVSLCRCYRERFGIILHHNVDKALLRGGSARPAFGGGQVVEPIEIFLAGRATTTYKGVDVPVAELAIETSRACPRGGQRGAPRGRRAGERGGLAGDHGPADRQASPTGRGRLMRWRRRATARWA